MNIKDNEYGCDEVVLPVEVFHQYGTAQKYLEYLEHQLVVSQDKAKRYDAINTPEIADFLHAVENEALHQRERWGSDHDEGKTDADWFWLIGHLAGKAMRPGQPVEKMLHHIITTAAACLNWHAARIGLHTDMRPGIGPDPQPPKPALPEGGSS
jgi:hypothetical protein